MDDAFPALARSAFRSKFRLDAADLAYLAAIVRWLAPFAPPGGSNLDLGL